MYALGIDIGTTGCKAVVVNKVGGIAGAGYYGYGLITADGGIVEQDPNGWIAGMIAAVRAALAGLDPGKVGALSLSTQAASSLLADGNGRPLTNALTWMDMRAIAQQNQIEGSLGVDAVYRTTGWRPHAALDMAKARWLAENREELFAKARWFLSTLEYANHYLAGRVAIDPTNAALRQLMDIRTKRWDDRMLAAARLPAEKLAPILPSGAPLGGLAARAADEMGLLEGVPVFNGAHDQYCGLLAAGILSPGDVMLSTGTAWVALAVSDKPAFTQSFLSPGPHVLDGLYGALASLPAAGASLDWLRNNVAACDYDAINREAAQRVRKNNDLFFFPYLSGAGFPQWESKARGTLLGMDLSTDRFDLALGCMEGAAFQLRVALDEYEAAGIPVNSLTAMGGAVNSPIWLSVVAAVTGKPLRVMRVRDTACLGAAMIAGVGAGMFENHSHAVRIFNRSAEAEPPDPWMTEHYQQKYRRFSGLWNILQSAYS